MSKTQKASHCETVKNPLGVPCSETVSKTQKASRCETAKHPLGDARSFGVKTDKMGQNWPKTDKSKPCESIKNEKNSREWIQKLNKLINL